MEKALAILDTDSIKKYVFGTNKLKEIRGASALLDDLNRHAFPDKVKEERLTVVYSNGGATLFSGPVDKVKQLLQEGENTYKEKTITGSATGCYVEYSEEDLKNDFKNIKLTLDKKLRLEKEGKKLTIPSFTGPYVKFCESCNIHPSFIQDRNDNSFICNSCFNKRNMDREIREETDKDKIKGLWGDFLYGDWKKNSEYKDYCKKDTEQAEDLSQIGETSIPENYIALIYCDGNCMGNAIEKLNSMDDFKHFSDTLDKTIREETYEALTKFFRDDRRITVKGEEKKIYPFDFLLLGGDDLLIVTAADKALDVTIEIMEKFETKLRDKKLTLSAGVVIAHAKYPIFNLLHLAEQLLKSAKFKNYELRKACNGNKNFSTIDFMVISSSNSLSLDDIRNNELTFTDNEETFTAFNRPYTVEELKKLMEFASKLKEVSFPKTKLNFMAESLLSTKTKSMLDTITIIGRLEKEQRKCLMEFFREFNVELMPWKKNGDKTYSTPLLDLLEIYDFTSERPGDYNV